MTTERCYGVFRVANDENGEETAWSISGNLTAEEASLVRDTASQELPAHTRCWIEIRRLD